MALHLHLVQIVRNDERGKHSLCVGAQAESSAGGNFAGHGPNGLVKLRTWRMH